MKWFSNVSKIHYFRNGLTKWFRNASSNEWFPSGPKIHYGINGVQMVPRPMSVNQRFLKNHRLVEVHFETPGGASKFVAFSRIPLRSPYWWPTIRGTKLRCWLIQQLFGLGISFTICGLQGNSGHGFQMTLYKLLIATGSIGNTVKVWSSSTDLDFTLESMNHVCQCFSTPMGWRFTKTRKHGSIPSVLRTGRGLPCRQNWHLSLWGRLWWLRVKLMTLLEDWLPTLLKRSWLDVSQPMTTWEMNSSTVPSLHGELGAPSLATFPWPLRRSKETGKQGWLYTSWPETIGQPTFASTAWHLTSQSLLLQIFHLLPIHNQFGSPTNSFYNWTLRTIRVLGLWSRGGQKTGT